MGEDQVSSGPPPALISREISVQGLQDPPRYNSGKVAAALAGVAATAVVRL